MISAPAENRKRRASRLPAQIYLPRTIGMSLGAISLGTVLWSLDRPPWVWGVFFFGGLLWPHMAYIHASRAKRSGRAERINLMVDAALTAFAVYAVGFTLAPSIISIAASAMNNVAVGGIRLSIKGCFATLAGFAIGAASLPLEFHLTSSLLVEGTSLVLAICYQMTFGWTMWRMAQSLQLSRDALHTLSQTDALSGMKNRGAFESILREKLHKLKGDEGIAVAALLLIDIDHFKKINDAYGHATGDEVVRAMAEALKTQTRAADSAARYGGDEFAVLLDQADEDDVHAFLDRISLYMCSLGRLDQLAIRPTWSTGVAMSSSQLVSTDAWMAQADAALYRVKQRQRGGVEFASETGQAISTRP